MPNPNPFAHALQPSYSVRQADGTTVTKPLEELTTEELDALIEIEAAAARDNLRHADALAAYADDKTQIGALDA